MYKKKLKTQKKNKAQPMDSSNSWFNNLLQKIKGSDNYLTTETLAAGVVVLIVIIVIITLLISPASFKRSGSKVSFSPTPTVSPSPTPTPIPLPRGPREYGVSNKENPQIRDLKLSEFSPKIGEKQSVTVSISDEKDGKVVSVTLKLVTDHKSKDYIMTLASGTDTSGDWTASWITDDTHNYIYNIIISATNDKGEKVKINPTFR